MKRAFNLAICILCFIFVASSAFADVYLNFDDFPVTVPNPGNVPGDSTSWEYSSSVTNDYGYEESESSGWVTKSKLSDGWNWLSSFNRNGTCSDQYYYDTYEYTWITSEGHSGNGLADTITGGLNSSCASEGSELYNLESYSGTGDISTAGTGRGHSYFYINKVSVLGAVADTTPFTSIADITDKNRLSMYVRLPAGFSLGSGGYNIQPQQTFQIGPFLTPASTASHDYFSYCFEGSDTFWAKMVVDEASGGKNGGGGATDDYTPGLLHTMFKIYFTTLNYDGGNVPEPAWTIIYDDIEFYSDTYTPQNNETIKMLSVGYDSSSQDWQVSMYNKYDESTESANAYSTFELRYSLSGAITNENWSSATPALIQADTRFGIPARSDGWFPTYGVGYPRIWAKFRLSVSDTASLTAGQTVYFAVKDVSQNPLDTEEPIDSINTNFSGSPSRKGGRPYDTMPTIYDYATDSAVLDYVKRVSYTIAGAAYPSCGDYTDQSLCESGGCNWCTDTCQAASCPTGSSTKAAIQVSAHGMPIQVSSHGAAVQ